MFVRTAAVITLVVLPAAARAQGAPAATRTDIPVKSVTLFSSGVGYFEHAGTVRGDGTTELHFKTAQINDILKSLVLQDQDGGKVTAITYPSQDPVSRTLKSFQVDITANPGMASLLNQLRGARVTVQVAGERLSGTILGVETRRKPVDKGEPIETPTLNVLTGATIRSVELPSITSLTLDDPQLEDELTKALAALSQARDQDKKPVTISFVGTGERRVRIGYVVETPIWKTSYRLMLEDRASRLQGWAIVENQTESDWNNVSLSLVSGRPISFIEDLYQPLYLQRPTVVPQLFAGLRPQTYDAGITGDAVNGLPVDRLPGGLALQPGNAQGGIINIVPRDQATTKQTVSATAANSFEDRFTTSGQSAASNTVASIARASQLGELFQYAIPNVTLARQKSAMLPIVTDTVGIERLSIYNAAVLPRNPLNGVRMKNTTGKHLLQGPVTVLDKGAYAGDAQVEDVPPGQERLLTYGIDLDVTVDNTKNTQVASVVTAKIVKGALLLQRRLASTRDYQLDNKATHDKQVVIEHPVRQGWKLVETLKPTETTPAVYRFQMTAPAGKVTVFTVGEESVREESIAILPADIGTLLAYSRTGEIPQGVRDAIIHAIQLKQAVDETDRQATEHTAQIDEITSEQERIRENMKTVDQKSQYYERLLAKLNDQESTIERLQKERTDLLAKRDTQRKALEDYLNSLNVDR